MNAVVVNCSVDARPRRRVFYNLGAHKLVDYLKAQGDTVRYYDGDPGLFGLDAQAIYLSAIFSWHVPAAREIALRMKGHADVWAGGPGFAVLGKWWHDETGLTATRGLDWRFERQRGNYAMTFASRGCPEGCSFCIVPLIEGRRFTLDWNFEPAAVLCDNNLSELPVDFQQHIVRRYHETSIVLHDANSGFEPGHFDEDCYQRWRPLLQPRRAPWRFAFDEQKEAAAVERMLRLLKDVPAARKQVYTLIGNEPIASCYDRCARVIAWGGEPFVQPYRPLNALSRQQFKVAYDWTPQLLVDFARYMNRHLYRRIALTDYRNRRHDSAPFVGRALAPITVPRPA